MSRGRPPLKTALTDKLEGSAQAKQRLKVILQTLSGELTIPQACETLDVGEARFHELRNEWLQAACVALEPKPLGRPKALSLEEEQELLRLHRENINLKINLRAAEIRTEIALISPHLLRDAQPLGELKKKS